MPYYLAPYIGSGTSTDDPFRPAVTQPGWSAIDLRPDGGATLGGGGLNACFLYLPVASTDAALTLVATTPQDTLSGGVKTAIRTTLGLSANPTASRFDLILAELLITPPTGKWKALRPEVSGRLNIYLGSLLYSQPVITGGAAIDETWTHADSAGALTADLTWTLYVGTGWGIVGNKAQCTTSGEQHARADVDLSANHACQAKLITRNASGSVDVTCRKDSTTTRTYYLFQATGTVYQLYKDVSASFTQLGANDVTVPVANDVFRIEANGSTIRAFINALPASMSPQTDTAIAGNTRCGIRTSTSGTTWALDDWHAEDLFLMTYRPRVQFY